jgi:glycosyltransferase involved in cell wall biosynthesis
VVHAHGLRTFAAARLATSGPVFVTLHALGPMPGEHPSRRRARDLGLRLAPHLAAGALVVVPTTSPGWRFLPHASPSLRAMSNVPSPPTSSVPTFMWVGRLGAPKDPRLFVRALAEVARQHPVRGFMVGDGPDRTDLEALIRRLDVDIKLTGHSTDVPGLMREAWAVALFSSREGIPFALQEAMWAGRPVVATRLPGTTWLVADGSGILVDDLASAVAGLEALTVPAVVGEMGRRAAATVRARITPDDPWPAVAELYEEALAKLHR